jgi:hypothetical protein
VAVASLWREVSVLEARLRISGVRVVDGPEIGTFAPAVARARDALYLFLSDDCPACHEVVASLPIEGSGSEFTTLAVRVRDDLDLEESPGADVFVALPPWIEAVPDELGDRIAAALRVRATPLAIAVRRGLIVAKGYLRGPEDLLEVARPLRPGAELEASAAR